MMHRLTITEALAEIKTIKKRIDKKREFVQTYIARDDRIRDPFENSGGSQAQVSGELQGISDLEARHIAIRLAIQAANERTSVTIGEHSRSITEWLIWRREVAPERLKFLTSLSRGLVQVRKEAQQKGMTVGVGAAVQTGQDRTANIIVNVNERDVSSEMERLETVLGDLDGQLSLKNATEVINLP